MKRWKSLLQRIFFPSLWLSVPLCILSAVLLAEVFLDGLEESLFAYGSYVLAFYSLCTVCCTAFVRLPGFYGRMKGKAYENPYSKRWLTDVIFKTQTSLCLSLTINLLYIVLNSLSWLLYRSAWFLLLAGYYSTLALVRCLLLHYMRKLGSDLKAELKCSRRCGLILSSINLALSGSVLIILYQNKGYHYPGMLIYVMALYTFYATIHAIADLIRYQKYDSPLFSTSKVLSLSSALVSMLALETSMLSQFGADMSPSNQRILIIATGAGVSLSVLGLSLWLIIRSTRRLRNFK